ncbi:hypothetical protein ACJ72_03235 [Emergomyces africanus]|uniref:Uncharacterized protein n=1 Tax=Emergomyces africanus TaxID=1955775 RepID=A0A1B7P0L6_9EURO|nr:hypothetical protein ACJ72_03235 [Emergomyces africanus]
MATLQASIRRSSSTLSSSYKPSLITIIQPSRPIQHRFINRVQASSFTASSTAKKEAQQEIKDQNRPHLDPNSAESADSSTYEVTSQQAAFGPSNTALESELEEARQVSASGHYSNGTD